MARWEFTSPDGTVHQAEGATQQEAFGNLQQQLSPKSQTPAAAAEPKNEGGGLGIAPIAGGLAKAAGSQLYNFAQAVPRGVTNAIVRMGSALPGAELPGLNERELAAHRAGEKEARGYAEGGPGGFSAGAGKIAGEIAPWALSEGVGGLGLAAQGVRMAAPAGARVAVSRALGMSPRLADLAAQHGWKFAGRVADNALQGGEAGALYSDDHAKGFVRGAEWGAATPFAGKAMEGVSGGAKRIFGKHPFRHITPLWLAHELFGHFLGPWGTAAYPLGYIAARAAGPAGRVVGSPAGAVSAGTIAGEATKQEGPDDNQQP